MKKKNWLDKAARNKPLAHWTDLSSWEICACVNYKYDMIIIMMMTISLRDNVKFNGATKVIAVELNFNQHSQAIN